MQLEKLRLENNTLSAQLKSAKQSETDLQDALKKRDDWFKKDEVSINKLLEEKTKIEKERRKDSETWRHINCVQQTTKYSYLLYHPINSCFTVTGFVGGHILLQAEIHALNSDSRRTPTATSASACCTPTC